MSQPWLPGDVYFGAADAPLPDWRSVATASDTDDDAPLSPGERKGLIGVLGFDPAEVDDKGSVSESLQVNTLSERLLMESLLEAEKFTGQKQVMVRGKQQTWFYQNGKRVANPNAQKPEPKKTAAVKGPTKAQQKAAAKAQAAQAQQQLHDSARAGVAAILEDPSSVTPQHVEQVGKALLTMKLADIQKLAAQLGKLKGRTKGALVDAIKKDALERAKTAAKPAPTPVPPPKPTPAPAHPKPGESPFPAGSTRSQSWQALQAGLKGGSDPATLARSVLALLNDHGQKLFLAGLGIDPAGKGNAQALTAYIAAKMPPGAKPAAPPKPPAGQDNARMAEVFRQQIHAAAHLSPQQKAEYSAAMDHVINRLPAKALERIRGSVQSMSFYTDTRKLGEELGKQSNKIASMVARGSTINGAFDPRDGKLHLDGKTRQVGDVTEVGGQKSGHRGTYAHELGHAVDWDPSTRKWTYSDTNEWDAICKEEIGSRPEEARLSAYATTNRQESFAELYRLVHGTDIDKGVVERRFPKASAYLKRNGLW